MHVKKGDMVQVIAGDDKGERGEVLVVDPKKGRIKVKGVNIVKKHLKANAQRTRGSIEEREAFFDASNVALIDPESDKPTRVGHRTEDGKKVRFAKASGKTIG